MRKFFHFHFRTHPFRQPARRAKARCSIPAGGSNRAKSPTPHNPGFNDGDWQAVSIPHNWGWEEAQQGKDFYRGPGWYRRDLNLGAPQSGKRYFLRFEAASLVADVYLNGAWLGQHRGAFGAFAFEITTNLSATGTNLLAVRVSNQREPDIAPLSGDFSVYGGIISSGASDCDRRGKFHAHRPRLARRRLAPDERHKKIGGA